MLRFFVSIIVFAWAPRPSSVVGPDPDPDLNTVDADVDEDEMVRASDE